MKATTAEAESATVTDQPQARQAGGLVGLGVVHREGARHGQVGIPGSVRVFEAGSFHAQARRVVDQLVVGQVKGTVKVWDAARGR